MVALVFLGLIPACSSEPGVPPPQVQPQAPAPDPATQAPKPAQDPASAAAPTTPQGFYDTCRERVEGPSVAGECSADADCVASGCSKEMCVSKATAGEGLMSPCEREPCFEVLDACTCQQGTCSWTLKAELPQALRDPAEPDSE